MERSWRFALPLALSMARIEGVRAFTPSGREDMHSRLQQADCTGVSCGLQEGFKQWLWWDSCRPWR